MLSKKAKIQTVNTTPRRKMLLTLLSIFLTQSSSINAFVVIKDFVTRFEKLKTDLTKSVTSKDEIISEARDYHETFYARVKWFKSFMDKEGPLYSPVALTQYEYTCQEVPDCSCCLSSKIEYATTRICPRWGTPGKEPAYCSRSRAQLYTKKHLLEKMEEIGFDRSLRARARLAAYHHHGNDVSAPDCTPSLVLLPVNTNPAQPTN